jgi:hypothetical protein
MIYKVKKKIQYNLPSSETLNLCLCTFLETRFNKDNLYSTHPVPSYRTVMDTLAALFESLEHWARRLWLTLMDVEQLGQ